MGENLVIVESPAKAKTIGKFLGNDYIVKSSFGHIRDLAKKNLGIDIENGFKPKYVVSPDKKKIVTELKSLAKEASIVWLASDEDREGEAIAWHLFDTLKLDPAKTRRIVFHEITKDAILNAIKNPRDIDINLVNAQQARRVLDRLVGFELSPVLWRKIKPKLSAGRVQSAALKLIVDKERDILKFKSKPYYKVDGYFIPEGTKTKVKSSLDKKFNTKEEAQNFLEKCQNSIFNIAGIDTKEATKYPAPPFTTSSLQQEAARKCGFSVSQTMSIAQKLYEEGRITYMRTDSTNLSKLALGTTKEYITNTFGPEYSKTRQYQTHSKGAQEAHEAIRPTFVNVEEIEGNGAEKRLYDLIRKRTIASQMVEAKVEKTKITIGGSSFSEKFHAQAEQIIFDGFLKVYIESNDDDNNEDDETTLLPILSDKQKMIGSEISATEKYTLHPARYTEASLVKKMEELGIGRPSTYAPTISTIIKREYVTKASKMGEPRDVSILKLSFDNGIANPSIEEKTKRETVGSEKGKLCPEDIGMAVSDYLSDHFDYIVDYNFTANVEESFDKIAAGKLVWNSSISDFYTPFHKKIEGALEDTNHVDTSRVLGVDPKTGKQVLARIGKFGPLVQLGLPDDKEKQFASLPKGVLIETITLDDALELFKLPRNLGQFEDKDVIVNNGRFGPYVRHNNKFVSIGKDNDPFTIDLPTAIQLILDYREKEIKKHIKEFPEEGIEILNGRYGPYIKQAKKNYKIPKGKVAEDLTLDECLEIISQPKESVTKRKKKSKK